MNLIVIFIGVTSLIYVMLLFLVFKKWDRGKAYRRYIMFLMTGTLWVIVGAIEVSSLHNNIEINLVLSKLDFILAGLIAYYVVLFSIHFPIEDKRLTVGKELILFIPILIIILLSVFNKIFYYIGSELTYSASGYILYLIVLFNYLLLIPSIILLKKLKISVGINKSRLKYILFGYFISASIALIFSVYFAINPASQTSYVFGYANIGTAIFAFSCFYAILRYRFMDIRVIIRKSLIYGGSLIFTLAIFTYFALLLKTIIEESWNINTTWTAIILIALVSLGFPLIKKLVEKLVNSIYKGRMSIDLAVKELREQISKKTDLEELIGIIRIQIGKYLNNNKINVYTIDHRDSKLISKSEDSKSSFIELHGDLIRYFGKYPTVLIREEISHLLEERQGKFEEEILLKAEKEMKKNKFSLVMPFKNDDEIFALLTLGEKEEGRVYTVQDINYLERLREQTGFILANAILYQETMEHLRLQNEQEI